MAASPTFTFVESYGGTYVTLTHTSDSGELTEGITVSLEMTARNTEYVYTYTIASLSADDIVALLAGKELFPTDFTGDNSIDTATVFPDDVYDVIYTVDTNDSNTKVVGFGAVVEEAVIKDSLGYNPDWDYATKDTINEKVRLLRNLKFALDTGDIDSFQINLEELQKLTIYE